MKIKLAVDLPIAKEHGSLAGRVFKVTEVTGDTPRTAKYFFKGDSGARCAAFHGEIAEFIEDDPPKAATKEKS